ncbi:Crp/Fnr family transcriptional regulator [Arthrospiribacter ruber]|uniref:Crp/Fnr family transcriptional regulator n=1 Tax=Arthrospiribacter ruber TaxID=2487934 RepID=A0A951ISF7_9BACT|nr:Crp/Fnr family transcriptional regulator [Arthrospiribacter ruber]MBW3466940.1 Crp/Fnr family transcriptional regulator [Arthrospiribacter ruber]
MNSYKPHCNSCYNEQCVIKKNRLNGNMPEYLENKNTMHCKKGQNFILEGAPVQGLYFVHSGKVKVAKTGFNGKEQIVRFAKDGEIIGHRGFGVGNFYQISAVAMEDTVLCHFSTTLLHEMLQNTPALTFDLMLFYAEELNRSETKVRKFAQMTVRERVIDSLLYIYRKFGQSKNLFEIQLTRKEIADFAGTTEEQVIRIISALKKEKLIFTQGKKIGIENVGILKKEIAEHHFFLDS